jgi:hypothetical protein
MHIKLARKPQKNRPLWKKKNQNIQMYFKEIGCEGKGIDSTGSGSQSCGKLNNDPSGFIVDL